MMSSRIAVGLFAWVMATASIAAAKPENAESFPHIPAMMHQQMKLGNTVVYDGEIDTAIDPGPQYVFQVRVENDAPYSSYAQEGYVATMQAGENNLAQVQMFTYLIRDVRADGSAKIDLIITRRDPARKLDLSELVQAIITIGQRHDMTTSKGTHLALLVQPDAH